MKKVTVLLMMLAASNIIAQQTNPAVVIQLTAEDAQKAALLDAEQKQLEKNISDFNQHIIDTYIKKNTDWPLNRFVQHINDSPSIKSASLEYQYTKDFKFIVPTYNTELTFSSCLGFWIGETCYNLSPTYSTICYSSTTCYYVTLPFNGSGWQPYPIGINGFLTTTGITYSDSTSVMTNDNNMGIVGQVKNGHINNGVVPKQ